MHPAVKDYERHRRFREEFLKYRLLLEKLQKIAEEIGDDIRKGDYIVTNNYTVEELKRIVSSDDC